VSAAGPDDAPGGVEFSVDGSVALIRIARPARLNALDAAASARLNEVVDRLESDDRLRAGIVTGTGERAFCAGADLTPPAPTITTRSTGAGAIVRFVRRARTKPLIAAVNGLAYGGGFEIVLACDMVVAVPHAAFAFPEALRGTVAVGGGALRLARVAPPAVAHRMLLTGEPIDAVQAERWGVVNEIVEPAQLLSVARALADRACRAAPRSVSATLAIVRAGAELPGEQAWGVNLAIADEVRLSEDAREGRRAFVEKRVPRWTGR
jgi:enoyl-CoA hydratase/carnithine racemase